MEEEEEDVEGSYVSTSSRSSPQEEELVAYPHDALPPQPQQVLHQRALPSGIADTAQNVPSFAEEAVRDERGENASRRVREDEEEEDHEEHAAVAAAPANVATSSPFPFLNNRVRLYRDVPLPQLIKLRGVYSSDHSFFVGYDWCYALCDCCANFIGWGFLRHDRVVQAAAETQAMVAAPTSNGMRAPSEQAQPAAATPLDHTPSPPTHEAAAEGRGPASASVPPSSSSPSQFVSSNTAHHDTEETDAAHTAGATVVRLDARAAPPPDFVAVIITHCTGASGYTERQFVRALRGHIPRRRRIEQLSLLQDAVRALTSQLQHRQLAWALHEACCWVAVQTMRTLPGSLNGSSDHDDDNESENENEEEEGGSTARGHEERERAVVGNSTGPLLPRLSRTAAVLGAPDALIPFLSLPLTPHFVHLFVKATRQRERELHAHATHILQQQQQAFQSDSHVPMETPTDTGSATAAATPITFTTAPPPPSPAAGEVLVDEERNDRVATSETGHHSPPAHPPDEEGEG